MPAKISIKPPLICPASRATSAIHGFRAHPFAISNFLLQCHAPAVHVPVQGFGWHATCYFPGNALAPWLAVPTFP